MPENKNMPLKVETGTVTIDLIDENEKKIGEFRFNPSDSNILKRYEKVVDAFDGMIYPAEETEDEQLKAINKLADDIAEQIDFLLGYSAADDIFRCCGPLSVTPNGDFFFEVVIEGIGRIVEQTSKERMDKKLAKIRKATEKYTKK